MPSFNDAGRRRPKWEHVIKHLDSRRWEDLRKKWASVAAFSGGIALPAAHGLSDLDSVRTVCENLDVSEPFRHEEDVPGLREGVLIESFALLLKALNVSGGAQMHLSSGVCGWSISSGYHSAFFAAKAICGMLGVALVEFDKTVLVDVWTSPATLSSKKRKAGLVPRERVMFIKWSNSRVDHEPVWKMLIRLLRVTDTPESLWPTSIVHFLKNCQADVFAYHRNRLHYENRYWPFPEELLSGFLVREGFGEIKQSKSVKTHIGELVSTEEFSIILGYVMTWMAIVLFADLAGLISGLSANCAVLKGALNQVYNARLKAFHAYGFPPIQHDEP